MTSQLEYVFRCPHCYSRIHLWEKPDYQINKLFPEHIICKFCSKNFELSHKTHMYGGRVISKSKNQIKGGDKMVLKMPIESTVNIPDGLHRGIIQKPEIKSYDYKGSVIEYVQIPIIMTDIDGIILNYSCPAKITVNTKLGKLLGVFVVVEGKDIDVEQVLEGKNIIFQTVQKESEKGRFAEIIPDSIKLDAE